jgi:hypothetical protein
VTAEGFSKEAFTAFLLILHGHYDKVPRVLDLRLLANIAFIVGYYECSHEFNQAFWRRNIQWHHWLHVQRDEQDRDTLEALTLQVFIEVTLGCPKSFFYTLDYAMDRADAMLPELDLPITRVIGTLMPSPPTY